MIYVYCFYLSAEIPLAEEINVLSWIFFLHRKINVLISIFEDYRWSLMTDQRWSSNSIMMMSETKKSIIIVSAVYNPRLVKANTLTITSLLLCFHIQKNDRLPTRYVYYVYNNLSRKRYRKMQHNFTITLHKVKIFWNVSERSVSLTCSSTTVGNSRWEDTKKTTGCLFNCPSARNNVAPARKKNR